MKSAGDEILSFIRVLVKNPDEVTITRIHGNPTVFEIKSCKAELDRLRSRVLAIRAIAVTFAAQKEDQFVIKFTER